jgi:SH3-like domain-containing protein
MRQVLPVNYLQPLPVQAKARSERVNNNIGPNNNTKVSFLDGLPDIWSDI